jgi:predicted ribosomally synthesized peptide with SipW-like signal peptide
MNKKRLIIVASLVLAVALVAAGTTMAYLTSAQTAVNQFGVGTLTPDIHENGSSTPQTVNSIPQTAAGVFPKVVKVENKNVPNAIDAYVRVQLVPTLRDATGTLGANFTMPATFSGTTITFTPFGDPAKQISLVFAAGWNNTSNSNGYWTYHAADNCFYYSKKLAPGETTAQALLSSVTFTGADAADWQAKFNLDVLTDSIQAGGTITTAGVTKAAAADAWPVTITGGVLTPNP